MTIHADSLVVFVSIVVPVTAALAACHVQRPATSDPTVAWPEKTYYRTVEVRGRRIFYREAGARDRPTLLLLHGYPSSSHSYRELIQLLSGRYHVVAPDNLGSGFSDHPSTSETTYTFDLLAEQTSPALSKRSASSATSSTGRT